MKIAAAHNFSSRSGASRSRLDLKGDEPFLGIGQDGEIRVGILPKTQKALVRFAGGLEFLLLLVQQAETIVKLNHVRGGVPFGLYSFPIPPNGIVPMRVQVSARAPM